MPALTPCAGAPCLCFFNTVKRKLSGPAIPQDFAATTTLNVRRRQRLEALTSLRGGARAAPAAWVTAPFHLSLTQFSETRVYCCCFTATKATSAQEKQPATAGERQPARSYHLTNAPAGESRLLKPHPATWLPPGCHLLASRPRRGSRSQRPLGLRACAHCLWDRVYGAGGFLSAPRTSRGSVVLVEF